MTLITRHDPLEITERKIARIEPSDPQFYVHRLRIARQGLSFARVLVGLANKQSNRQLRGQALAGYNACKKLLKREIFETRLALDVLAMQRSMGMTTSLRRQCYVTVERDQQREQEHAA